VTAAVLMNLSFYKSQVSKNHI